MSKTEKLIRHKRKRSGILVPMIEDFMRKPVNIETPEDVKFIHDLTCKMMTREQSRNGRTVFSPSALASCLRYVYLQKHHKQLEIVKAAPMRIEPHHYFLTGNFLHMKVQFLLFKMIEAGVDGLEPLDLDSDAPYWCEVPIMSKRGDHGGTLDAALKIHQEPVFIDAKGVNVRTFGESVRGYAPMDYRIQLTDYMVLYNSRHKNTDEKITRSLLLFENKGGPDAKHPAALHEVVVELSEYRPEVRRRLEVLREHEAAEEIPPPECVTTKGFQFAGCAFQKYCKAEVKEVEKHRDIEDRKTPYAVARPKGKTRRKRR